MEERDLGEPEPEIILKSWQDHPWTAEEIAFCGQMLQHGNKSRAIRAAGLVGTEASPPVVVQAANRMLGRSHIREYLEYVRGEMAQQLLVSKDRILEEVARLAYANMSDFIVIENDGTAYTDLSGLTRDQLAAIQDVEIHTYVEKSGDNEGRTVKSVKVKLAPKLPALDLLGKSLKMWTDVVETNTNLVEAAATMRERRKKLRAEREAQANGTNEE